MTSFTIKVTAFDTSFTRLWWFVTVTQCETEANCHTSIPMSHLSAARRWGRKPCSLPAGASLRQCLSVGVDHPRYWISAGRREGEAETTAARAAEKNPANKGTKEADIGFLPVLVVSKRCHHQHQHQDGAPASVRRRTKYRTDQQLPPRVLRSMPEESPVTRPTRHSFYQAAMSQMPQ